MSTVVFDNLNQTVCDDLKKVIRKGTKIAAAAPCFSLYAYDALKKQLESAKEFRFIFTEPTFVERLDDKLQREFVISKLKRERSLYGTEFEIKLRNEMTQRAVARDCVGWLRRCAKFKSNVTGEYVNTFMLVDAPDDRVVYQPLNGFTSVGLGCKRGDCLSNIVSIIRQKFIGTGEYVSYVALDKILKADKEYPDYRAMPAAQSAQQVLRLLDKNWQAFFAAIKDWKVHKNKYLGRPKLPKYKKKSGLYVLALTNQSCRLKGEPLHFPRTFKSFIIKPKFVKKPFEKFLQARFIPAGTDIMLELVYEVADVPTKSDNGIYASVDLGVDNLAAFVTNTAAAPLLINGRPLKAVNQFYNKRIARLQSLCPKHFSRRMSLITSRSRHRAK